jgi:hypothetical protein
MARPLTINVATSRLVAHAKKNRPLRNAMAQLKTKRET